MTVERLLKDENKQNCDIFVGFDSYPSDAHYNLSSLTDLNVIDSYFINSILLKSPNRSIYKTAYISVRNPTYDGPDVECQISI